MKGHHSSSRDNNKYSRNSNINRYEKSSSHGNKYSNSPSSYDNYPKSGSSHSQNYSSTSQQAGVGSSRGNSQRSRGHRGSSNGGEYYSTSSPSDDEKMKDAYDNKPKTKRLTHSAKRKGYNSDSSDSSLSDTDSEGEYNDRTHSHSHSHSNKKRRTGTSMENRSSATPSTTSTTSMSNIPSLSGKSLFDVPPTVPAGGKGSLSINNPLVMLGLSHNPQHRLPGLGNVGNEGILGLGPANNSKFSNVPPTSGVLGVGSVPPRMETPLDRQARRVYVGNIPKTLDEQQFIAFFEEVFDKSGLFDNSLNNKLVVSHTLNREKGYAFIDFANPQHAQIALKFDGLKYLNNNLKFRKPNMLQQPPTATATATVGTGTGTAISSVGEGDNGGGVSSMVVEPLTPTEQAITQILNFSVRLDQSLINILQQPNSSGLIAPSNVIALINLFSDDELFKIGLLEGLKGCGMDIAWDMVYGTTNSLLPDLETIKGDITLECSKYGRVKGVQIILPTQQQLEKVLSLQTLMGLADPDQIRKRIMEIDYTTLPLVNGLGKVLVTFYTTDEARLAQQQFGGKRYRGRTIVTTYHNEK